MNALEAVGLVSGIASIAGLIYAVYYGRTSVRKKQLAFDFTPAVPLATVLQPDDTHRLTILYEHVGKAEERIAAAYIRFLRFANFGREPIRREDIAAANSFRIEITDARTLDVALVGTHRNVCKLEVQHLAEATGSATAAITFDFLDYRDGGMVRIVTADSPGRVRLKGDIIGMPEGIRRGADIRPHNVLNTIGCSLGLLVQLAALVITPFIYQTVTGSWEHAWVMLLPFVALILPGAIVGIIAATIWPDSDIPFPKDLTPPHWFMERMHLLREARIRRGPAAKPLSEPSYQPFLDEE